MPGLSRAYDPAAVEALLAATPVEGPHEDLHVRLEVLLAAVTDALGAQAGALQSVDDRTATFQLVAGLGLPAAVAPALETPVGSGIAGRAVAESGEVEVHDGGAEGLLPAALGEEGIAHALAIPVRARERVLGVVWAASTAPIDDDPVRRHAARVAAESMGWILEQTRLTTALERAMAQILETDERMLGRIGLDIHDGPTQQLSVALLEVQLLQAKLDDAESAGPPLPDGLRAAIGRIYETVGGALVEMRELIGHLRPAQFEDRGLPEVLEDAMLAHESRTGATVARSFDGEFRDEVVSITQKITFYRILQEALSNSHRHGQAHRLTVAVGETPAGITMEVADNGVGFDPESIPRPRPGMPQARFGVYGMRDRAQLLGGSCAIQSAPGRGTVVRVFLPRWRPPARPDDLGVAGAD
jgi:signal transduction histidine kinase